MIITSHLMRIILLDITTEELDKRCREIMNIDENIQVSRSVAEGIVGNTILNEYEYDTLCTGGSDKGC